MADYNVAGVTHVSVPVEEYQRLIESSKQSEIKAPIAEQESSESNWAWTATKIIGAMGLMAAAGYGLYRSGYSVGARNAADLCEQKVLSILTKAQNSNVVASLWDIVYDKATNVFSAASQKLSTLEGYVKALVILDLSLILSTPVIGAMGLTTRAVNFISGQAPSKSQSSWTWTAAKVVGTLSIMAAAGYGIYYAGVSLGSRHASSLCEEGIANMNRTQFLDQITAMARNRMPAAITAGANSAAPSTFLGEIYNLLAPLKGSELSIVNGSKAVDSISNQVYNAAMANMTLPSLNPFSYIDEAKEAVEDLKWYGKAALGTYIGSKIVPPVIGALKFGARVVRFIAFRR